MERLSSISEIGLSYCLWLASTSKKLFPSQVPWIHVFLVGPKWMNEEARPGRLQELLLCLSSYFFLFKDTNRLLFTLKPYQTI